MHVIHSSEITGLELFFLTAEHVTMN